MGGDQSKNQANEGETGESLRGWIAILLSVLLICSTTALFTAGQAFGWLIGTRSGRLSNPSAR